MTTAKRSGKHLLLPEVRAWYDTLSPVRWNDFESVQAVRDFVEPGNASTYGPMPSNLAKIYEESAQGPQGIVPLKVYEPQGIVPLKVYEPQGTGPFPIIVYYHGGGWVLGSNTSHRAAAATLASECKAVAVAVEYRLAPEHPFPTGVEDSWAALQWVAANAGKINGDADKIAVCGESAGGTMSIVMSMLAKQRQQPFLIKAQIAICPGTDLLNFNSPSFMEFADDEFEGTDDIKWFDNQYLSGPRNDPKDPLVSPLFDEDCSGLPPSLIITAEVDVLRDEGEQYAEKLRAAGVHVQLNRMKGHCHNSMLRLDLFDGKGKSGYNAKTTYKNIGAFVQKVTLQAE